MNYVDWLTPVPEEITATALWKNEAYRLTLFVSEIGWRDGSKHVQDQRTLHLSDQLYKSLGSFRLLDYH